MAQMEHELGHIEPRPRGIGHREGGTGAAVSHNDGMPVNPGAVSSSSALAASPAPGRGLRLMAVHAHPDDESSKGAATMARYVSEGVEVLVVTCTGGEAGSVLNPALDKPEILERLPELRREEMERARAILGVRQTWLGFLDSGLPEGDPLPPLPAGSFGTLEPEHAA